MFYCLVAGSRSFNDYEMLRKKLDEVLEGKGEIEIVEGGARGADALAARYAKERGHSLREFPADWGAYGNSAGYIRNQEMFEYIVQFPDKCCVLIWGWRKPGYKARYRACEKI